MQKHFERRNTSPSGELSVRCSFLLKLHGSKAGLVIMGFVGA